MQNDPYASCLERMFSLRRFGIKLGLDLIGTILERLGNPHTKYRTIHIAGTNGKGSVAAYISAILNCAGYRVGRYTSPHLERFNERICIDDQPISDSEVVAAYERVKSAGTLEREPTFFEFATAMAMDAFARHRVEWAVIETGMGGRLDATNVLAPDLSVITNISTSPGGGFDVLAVIQIASHNGYSVHLGSLLDTRLSFQPLPYLLS